MDKQKRNQTLKTISAIFGKRSNHWLQFNLFWNLQWRRWQGCWPHRQVHCTAWLWTPGNSRSSTCSPAAVPANIFEHNKLINKQNRSQMLRWWTHTEKTLRDLWPEWSLSAPASESHQFWSRKPRNLSLSEWKTALSRLKRQINFDKKAVETVFQFKA